MSARPLQSETESKHSFSLGNSFIIDEARALIRKQNREERQNSKIIERIRERRALRTLYVKETDSS